MDHPLILYMYWIEPVSNKLSFPYMELNRRSEAITLSRVDDGDNAQRISHYLFEI